MMKNDELHVTWQTPLGPMTGRVAPAGVRALHFPDRASRTLLISEAEAAEIKMIAIKNGKGENAEQGHAAMAVAEAVTEFLKNYFVGRPIGHGPRLDFNGASAFDRAVWEATQRVPRGRTCTYGQIAGEIGRPGAARAVGGALGRNPLVILVPCHRVISTASGPKALCGFTGGLELKKYLLDLEGIRFE